MPQSPLENKHSAKDRVLLGVVATLAVLTITVAVLYFFYRSHPHKNYNHTRVRNDLAQIRMAISN